MSERRFRKNDLVKFQLGPRFVEGVVKEDRGPIGLKGRRLFLVEFRFEPQAETLSHIELPADALELVQDPAGTSVSPSSRRAK